MAVKAAATIATPSMEEACPIILLSPHQLFS
jgi:hypothetical protein